MKWELAIAIKDKEDTPTHKRSKRGDIIAFKPSPWEWGKEEKKLFLIVVVDGLTKEAVEEMVKEHRDLDVVLPMNHKDYVAPTIFAKRKYKIDIDKLKTIVDIDETKLLDETLDYQPVKDKVIEISATRDLDLIYDKKFKKYKKVKK